MLTLATSDQLNRALYSSGSQTTTEALLYDLEQKRYLKRIWWRRFERGNPKSVWKLASRGMRYIKAHNLAPGDLIRPSDNTTHTRSQLTHTLRVTDLLVYALELQRQDPSLQLYFASEPTLRRHPLVVGSGLNEVVIYPDGFLRMIKEKDGSPGEAAFGIEVTRTTDFERIKLKMENWLRADGSSEYYNLLGTDLLIVLWVVDEGNVRKRDMIADMTWDHLKRLHLQDQADLFLIGAVHEDLAAEDFFFSPMWRRPGEDDAVSLLPRSWQ